MNSLSVYCREKRRLRNLYVTGIGIIIWMIAAGLMLGSSHIEAKDIFEEGSASWRILWYVRVPRTMACLITGSALSVAGAVLQAVLANRLASASIIGVNSGAGFAVTVCTALGVYSGWTMNISAWLGAMGAVFLISAGARKWNASKGTVILAGVALNSFLNALSQAIVTFNPEISVMSNDFKVGDFSNVTYERLIPALVLIIGSLLILQSLRYDLDVMTLGDENARGLGMDVRKTRIVFLILTAVLAASAVMLAGLVSFVGLLIPHGLRRLRVYEAKHLLPLCGIWGAGFVAGCDLAARTLFAPFEIPVGIILSCLGAPFFVILLLKKNGGHRHD